MRASSPSTPRPRWRCPACWRCYTGADLVAAGVKPMASQPMFPGPGGAKAPQTPRHALAVDARALRRRGGGRGGRRHAPMPRAPAATRWSSTTKSCRTWCTWTMPSPPARPRSGPTRPTTIAAEMRHGSAEACAAAFAKAAHVVALDLENQRLAPTSLEPRTVLGSFDAGARDAAHEQPDARRRARHAVQRGLRLAHRQAARGGRRCRRRLRHEDRRLSGGHRRRLLRAHAASGR